MVELFAVILPVLATPIEGEFCGLDGMRCGCVLLLPVLASMMTRLMTLSCGRNPISANTLNIKILIICCGTNQTVGGRGWEGNGRNGLKETYCQYDVGEGLGKG